jgi:hypothetical protein
MTTTLKRIRLRLFTALTASSVLFASATPSALAGDDLQIRTVSRYSGSPVQINPRISEDILYLQNNRRRGEERRQQVNPLWPGGPQVTFYEPHTALIESCDGDARKEFALNLDNHTYAPIEMSRKLTSEEMKAFKDRGPQYKTPTRPTVRHEITTSDTGERKQAFGYYARHVTTTSKIIPLEDSEVMGEDIVTDGWYIDLDTGISCDPERAAQSEGAAYAVVQMSGGAAGHAPDSVSKPSLVQTTYIGKPETGFPIWIRTTMRQPALVQGVKSEQVDIAESGVTLLSAKALNPSLFEVPKDFRSVPQILPVLRVAFWAGWLAWGHYYWVRFKQAI